MLFDLRGRGRRNTIKVIYILLAFLMGGGLVLFGIGGNTSGGLVDAITGNGGGGDVGAKRFAKQEEQALATLRTNPKDEAAYVQLVRARVQLAGSGDNYDPNTDSYNAKGKAQLRKASGSWDQYLALNPKDKEEESRLASIMTGAFVALGDLSSAVRAQEIVAETRDSPGAYSNLAVFAYQAGQTRKGDLAAQKAIDLTPKDKRQALKMQLDQAKKQGAAGAAQPQSGG
jgi:tetratricopeptide (TPR) repeat protein